MAMQVPNKVLAMMVGRYAPPVVAISIDAPATSRMPDGSSAKVTMGDLLPEFRCDATQEDAIILGERREALRAAIAALPTPQRTCIEGRLRGLTLADVGAAMGRSRERARQLERDALAALRAALARFGATGTGSLAQKRRRWDD
ncbi:MAG: sigma factor-like helix-turn-helix DNA-binding protein [Candidatus Polarisedimenticolia bacterium]|nr:hypothetical protein [bacterium]